MAHAEELEAAKAPDAAAAGYLKVDWDHPMPMRIVNGETDVMGDGRIVLLPLPGHTPETMAAWVTDVPNYLDRRVIPLQFRFLTAMQGALGIGSNLTKWSPEEADAATRLVTFYKTVRTTVQHGNLFRLKSPAQSEDSQVEYVSQDGSQAVLFAYLHSQHYGLAQPLIQFRGLDAQANYRVTPLDAAKYGGDATVSGAVLMGQGISLALAGDYDSTAVMLQRVPAAQ